MFLLGRQRGQLRVELGLERQLLLGERLLELCDLGVAPRVDIGLHLLAIGHAGDRGGGGALDRGLGGRAQLRLVVRLLALEIAPLLIGLGVDGFVRALRVGCPACWRAASSHMRFESGELARL